MPSPLTYGDVRFSDLAGNVLFETSEANGSYLGPMDEKPPKVKTITVNVPAADGSLDLTEAVAGRPLYGNRTITMEVFFTAEGHPEAYESARGMRRAIHGRMCKVETPDTLMDPDPPVGTTGGELPSIQGYYIGRVSVDQVKFPGEAAVVKLTVDAKPWVYYGTGTVTLQAGTPTTYANGNGLPGDTSYTRMDMAITRRSAGMVPLTGGEVPNVIGIAPTTTINLLQYGRMFEWRGFHCDIYDNWEEDASGTWWTDNGDGTATIAASSAISNGTYRLVTVCPAGDNRADDSALMVSDSLDKLGVFASGMVAGGNAKALYQGAYLYTAPSVDSNGLLPGGGTPIYESLRGSAGEVSAGIRWQNPADVTGLTTDEGYPLGFAIIGVEMKGSDIDHDGLTVGAVIGQGETSATFPVAPQILNLRQLPVPLYAIGVKRNTVNVSMFGNSETVTLDKSGSAVVEVTPRTEPMAGNVWYSVAANTLRAYALADHGFLPLALTVKEWPTDTVTADFGDMPTQVTLDTTDPVTIVSDGRAMNMAQPGILPVQLTGTETLSYSIHGTHDATISFEKGTV